MGAEQSDLSDPNNAGHLLLKSKSNLRRDYLTFFVNGEEHTVNVNECDPDIGPTYLLLDYLRDKLGLTGTKYMCREGGCGSCIVSVKSYHSASGQELLGSVNSCLLPLYACDGLEITTVEALGNRRDGYSKIQDSLVKFGGTQCGYCTPGFVMNMHSLALSKPKFTPGDVEYSFDGNICRCTGFRPIIEAFKALSVDVPEELKRKCGDIEDSYKCLSKKNCAKSELEIVNIPRTLHLRGPLGEQWVKVLTLENLFQVLKEFASAGLSYRLVAGNTGTGVFKNDGPYQGYIDINDIPDLKHTSIDSDGVIMGGSVTLTTAIDVFDRASKQEGLEYAQQFYVHFRRVACLSVRNRGTLAGNLMLKHDHPEFYSDVFLLLEGIGAMLEIGSSSSIQEHYTLTQFLKLNMNGKVILSVHLPVYKGNYVFRTFKIGKRYQNATAYVNAALLFEFDEDSLTIKSRPRICYGGINPGFVHANQTELYLEGKKLNVMVLQKALKYLEHEAVPDDDPSSASPKYRLGLAQSYLYKVLLQLIGNVAKAELRSGGYSIERSLNTAQQDYDTDQSKWPLYQPIPKLESYEQASGEAQFINDMRPEFNELHGVFVLATVAKSSIKSIDASRALNYPGVVGFYTAKDIPGVNNFTPLFVEAEEVFADKVIKYAGQPIGLLVARSRNVAMEARKKIVIKYENIKQPVLDIREAVNNLPKDFNPVRDVYKLKHSSFPCKSKGFSQQMTEEIVEALCKPPVETDPELLHGKKMIKLKGELKTSPQYHFHMETQTCVCVPSDTGMDIYSATQCMNFVQASVAAVLNVPLNSLRLIVKRIGGGFGGKATRSSLIAAACAVASHATNKPVRVVLDLETNMQMVGKRLPYLGTYKVQVDETGKVYKLESNIYCDVGAVSNEPTSLYGMICSQSCYQALNWNATPGVVTTDTPTNTYCRAPGSCQGVAIIETIMEHIAHQLNLDPMQVREVNFIKKGDNLIGVPGAKLPLANPLPKIIADMKESCDYDDRKRYIDDFNANNRWKKRGISIVPQRYPSYYWDSRVPTFLAVYGVDGTVSVSHGGIEMGQGINTKVAQVVAHTLAIPLQKVKIHAADNLISPNATFTAGSITSEVVCSSARRACLQLLEKLEPLRKRLGNPTWEQLVAAANSAEILLTSQFQEQTTEMMSYDIWGVTCTEIELDVLTGDFKIVRSDIVEDAGQSLSPLVDIGQVEGAFIMGLSWWLMEELIYDKDTGALLTDNTWTYKPMLPADIPEDLRVTLLKNAPNPFGVLSSKATAEPPLNMSVAVVFALRQAITSARREVGDSSWYQMDGPVTKEKIRELALTSADKFYF